MALSERLDFILGLDANGAIRGFQRVGDTAERELGRADNRLDRIGAGMQRAGAGAVALAGVAGRALAGFASASEDAERQSRHLSLAVANAGDAAGGSTRPFEDLARALQRTTTADGDAVVGLEAFLLTAGRTREEVLELTPLVVDFAIRYGLGFEQAGRIVNRAIDGNVRGLRAYIGNLREGESVQDALNRTVGGAGALAAETFSGKLEQLRNNLGDVAEGLGSGVVDAANQALGPIMSLSDAFTGLDPASQKAAGRVAAYSTAAIGAVGATSFLAGTVLRMRDRFVQVDAATGQSTGKLNLWGKAAGGIAALGLAATLYEVARAMNQVTVNVDEFATSSGTQLESFIRDQLPLLEHYDVSIEQIARQLVEENVPAAERFADALEQQGRDASAVRQAIEEKRRTDQQAAVDQAAYGEEVATAAEQTRTLTRDTRSLVDAIKAGTDAIEANRDALEESVDADTRRERSIIDLQEELERFTDTNRDAEATDRDRARAEFDARDAIIARGRAEFEATGSTQAQVAALLQVASTLSPGSPLRRWLEEYIGRLSNIPRFIETVVGVRTIRESEDNRDRQTGRNLRDNTKSNITVNVNGLGLNEASQQIARDLSWEIN